MRRAHGILLHTLAIGAMAVGTAGNARAAAISYSTAFCFDVSTTPCTPTATTATTSRSSGGSTANVTVTGGLFDVDIPSGTFVKLGTIDPELIGSAFSTNFVLRMLLTQHGPSAGSFTTSATFAMNPSGAGTGFVAFNSPRRTLGDITWELETLNFTAFQNFPPSNLRGRVTFAPPPPPPPSVPEPGAIALVSLGLAFFARRLR